MIHFISNKPQLIQEELINYTDLEQLQKWLYYHDKLYIDTETTGLFDFKSRVIMLQIGDATDQYVIDVRGLEKELARMLESTFQANYILKIFHNAKFDVNMIRSTFGLKIEYVYDTFVAECCLTNGQKGRQVGLNAVTKKYCDRGLNKAERESFLKIEGDEPFTYAQILYGAQDIENLPCIMEKQTEAAEAIDLSNVIWLENQAVLALADIEYNGLYLDKTEWLNLAQVSEIKEQEFIEELDRQLLEDERLKGFKKRYVQTAMFDIEERKVGVSWSSPIQVQKVFKALGLKEDSTSEKEIGRHQNSYPLVKTFIDYKKQQKLSSTYGRDFLDYINPVTGRIHTSFWQFLETGRISSNNPNIQNIPAKPEYLCCFKAPKGMKIVGTDFSAQELKIIAEGSKDPVWINAFNEGKDLHGEMAALIFDIPIEDVRNKPEFVFVGTVKVYLRGKSSRDVAKTVGFMLAFGGSKYKLSDTLGISLEEADAIIMSYFAKVPGVKRFLDACATYGLSKRYIRSFAPYSIIRYFDSKEVQHENEQKYLGEIDRASRNTPIQGTASQMTKLAMVELRAAIADSAFHVQMILQIHDAIYCYVEEEHAEEWSVTQSRIFKQAGEIFIKSIPVTSDITITDCWSK